MQIEAKQIEFEAHFDNCVIQIESYKLCKYLDSSRSSQGVDCKIPGVPGA